MFKFFILAIIFQLIINNCIIAGSEQEERANETPSNITPSAAHAEDPLERIRNVASEEQILLAQSLHQEASSLEEIEKEFSTILQDIENLSQVVTKGLEKLTSLNEQRSSVTEQLQKFAKKKTANHLVKTGKRDAQIYSDKASVDELSAQIKKYNKEIEKLSSFLENTSRNLRKKDDEIIILQTRMNAMARLPQNP